MFLSKVNKVGKVAKVESKATGRILKVRLLAKSELTPKMDLFIVLGKNVVWRDSLRRRYYEV